MIYDLPQSVEVQGAEYEIRSDYRAVLDICIALSDPDLSDQDRAQVALEIFYPGFSDMPSQHYQEALKQCFWFINGGENETSETKSPRLVSWEQDFRLIAAPVNRVLGKEIRSLPYLHWWSFLAAYYEIGGDCTFAQVVGIRSKLARHQKLDKSEREWLRRNHKLVDFKRKYTSDEEALLQQWT